MTYDQVSVYSANLHEGEQLRAFMNYYQISTKELAQRLDMTTSNLNQIAHRRTLSAKQRGMILNELGIDYAEFCQPLGAPIGEGGHLRVYLRRHGIAAQWLAAQLNVTKSTITSYFQTRTFSPVTRRVILAVLQVDEEQVFTKNDAQAPLASFNSIPPPVPRITQGARALAAQHLADWQALHRQLVVQGASSQERAFCQYQIWHLELSLPALGLSLPPAPMGDSAQVDLPQQETDEPKQ